MLALQNILIQKGYLSSDSNTGYFGVLTKAALIKYQTAMGISPAVGYFGPLTIASLGNLPQNLLGTPQTSVVPATPVNMPREVQLTYNLAPGVTDTEVIELQSYLNSHEYIVAASGPGSPGHESSYFGPATEAALIKFQKAKGIVPASGYFGSLTRTVMNQE